MQNDFVKALGNKDFRGYKAFCLLENGEVGVSPEYSKNILNEWIKENKDFYVKILKIEKSNI
jgi:hypothetical protein